MPRKVDKAETKLRMSPEEKERFERAAEASKRSLNQWLIVAGVEKADRDGVPQVEKRKGGGR